MEKKLTCPKCGKKARNYDTIGRLMKQLIRTKADGNGFDYCCLSCLSSFTFDDAFGAEGLQEVYKEAYLRYKNNEITSEQL